MDQPVAITGQIGYAIPARNFTMTFAIDPDTGAQTIDTEFNPRVLNRGVSIRYSMPLSEIIRGRSRPEGVHQSPYFASGGQPADVGGEHVDVGKGDHRYHQPSTIWVGSTFQFDIEALIPINRPSGSNVGVIAQLHLYLDEIGPRGIGKPLFGGPVQPVSPFRGIDQPHAIAVSLSRVLANILRDYR